MIGFRKVRKLKLVIFSCKLPNADFGLVVRVLEDTAFALQGFCPTMT
jgi:hypothetical protein